MKAKKLRSGGFEIQDIAVGEFVAQGDVVVMRVDSIPADAVPGKRDAGRIVLAYGEVTGHAHAIADQDVEVFVKGDTMYLRVPEGTKAKLAHEEHGTFVLPGGTYLAGRQFEYDPVAEGEIRVAD